MIKIKQDTYDNEGVVPITTIYVCLNKGNGVENMGFSYLDITVIKNSLVFCLF